MVLVVDIWYIFDFKHIVLGLGLGDPMHNGNPNH